MVTGLKKYKVVTMFDFGQIVEQVTHWQEHKAGCFMYATFKYANGKCGILTFEDVEAI